MLTRWIVRRVFKPTGVVTEFLTDFVTTAADIDRVCDRWENVVWGYRAVAPVEAVDWYLYPQTPLQAAQAHVDWCRNTSRKLPDTLLGEWRSKSIGAAFGAISNTQGAAA